MKTQGEQLIALLKRKPMTTMELLQTGISTCPWRRIAECLESGWTLSSHKHAILGIKVYRVLRTEKPKTAWVGGKYPKSA